MIIRPPIRLGTNNKGSEHSVKSQTGQNFVINSAARVNTLFYCLDMLQLAGNATMQNTVEGVYAIGYASYTISLDGSRKFVINYA